VCQCSPVRREPHRILSAPRDLARMCLELALWQQLWLRVKWIDVLPVRQMQREGVGVQHRVICLHDLHNLREECKVSPVVTTSQNMTSTIKPEGRTYLAFRCNPSSRNSSRVTESPCIAVQASTTGNESLCAVSFTASPYLGKVHSRRERGVKTHVCAPLLLRSIPFFPRWMQMRSHSGCSSGSDVMIRSEPFVVRASYLPYWWWGDQDNREIRLIRTKYGHDARDVTLVLFQRHCAIISKHVTFALQSLYVRACKHAKIANHAEAGPRTQRRLPRKR
jgi:hypothetical protein